jgi:putative MATE family efflux protein
VPPPSAPRSVDRRIVALALPAVLTIAADPLYDLTDTAILGHIGTDALAGAALAAVVLATGYAIFVFLLYGTTASVARLVGAGRDEAAAHLGVQALWLAAACGTTVALVLWPAAPLLVSAFGGRGAVADAALTYFRISLLGFPAFFLVMAGAGYRRGIQDLRTPLVVTVGTAALNVVLEVVLVYGFHRGVGASAAGTVVAKWLGALLYVALVVRPARARRTPLRPDTAALRQLSSTGLPLFVRTVALRGAFAVAVAVAGRVGRAELAAYAVAFQVSAILAYLCEGLEVAAHALVGNALGGGDGATARVVGARVIRMGLAVGVAGGAIVAALHGVIPALFTSDPDVRTVAAGSLLWIAGMQPVAGVAYALDGILIGAGDLRFLAVAMVGAAAGFVALAGLVLASGPALGPLWAALTAFMALRALLLGSRFAVGGWARLGLSGSSPTPTP